MIHLTRRLIRFIGWLVTPVIAFAAAFGGGWLGAVAAPNISSASAASIVVAASAVLGGIGGAGVWAVALRQWRRHERRLRRERRRDSIEGPSGENAAGVASPTE